MKLSYDGSVIWTREDSMANGYHYCSYNHSLVKLSDDNFLAMGHVSNDFKNPKNYDCVLPVYIKFNSNGDTIWRRIIPDTVGMKVKKLSFNCTSGVNPTEDHSAI